MVQKNLQPTIQRIKGLVSRFKPYLRWVIFGGTLFFLAKALKDHALEVAQIRLDDTSWSYLGTALGVTLLGHVWSGWVWLLILQQFNQRVPTSWGLQVYLKTNLAKYLPGNVWHFYGRISAITSIGISTSIATLSVLMEPVLMAAAALIITLAGTLLLGIKGAWGISPQMIVAVQLLSLVAVLGVVHQRFLNPLMKFVGRLKQKATGTATEEAKAVKIQRYPIVPLLGEIGFLGLRGTGFCLTLLAVSPISPSELPLIFSVFSFAWLVGLVFPGAPGGIGVFEAIAIALLDGEFSPATILSAVALYRLISILAEAGGALVASLDSAKSRFHERKTIFQRPEPKQDKHKS